MMGENRLTLTVLMPAMQFSSTINARAVLSSFTSIFDTLTVSSLISSVRGMRPRKDLYMVMPDAFLIISERYLSPAAAGSVALKVFAPVAVTAAPSILMLFISS